MSLINFMDKNTKQTHEDSNEENKKNETSKEYEVDFINHPQTIRESDLNYKSKQNKMNSQHNQRERNYSRSRSPNSTKSSKKWISSNAFINFVQDFRQNCTNEKSTKIFQLAGERWRKMSFEEKQPYVNEALSVKNQRVSQKNKYTNKLQTNTESTKNENIPKQEKVNKKSERNKKVNFIIYLEHLKYSRALL
ncbi:high mobility group B protein 4-like [Osmia bicornis bicornis]|uniref:high mobility group B protein 4-like n=1 Tax=Osmia bicornis bicornis TaxID=1437191 RepID=UPI0010F8396B|nr:high mobility group B protein 4-like [Osmia bicornis bicornis]